MQVTSLLRSTIYSTVCTEIKSNKDLEKVLGEVTVPLDEICRDLDLHEDTCSDLANTKTLRMDTMAVKYMDQNPKACWEKVVHNLCKDFDNEKLAKEVADKYHVPEYTKYCQ